MARVGTGNYTHSTHGPVCKDIFWREGLMRERWDHQYHALNITRPPPSYKDMNTTTNDFLGRTWHILNHTYSSAQGKSAYEFNMAKPSGNVVRMGRTQEGGFDPWRPTSFSEAARRMRSESPMSTGRPSKGPFQHPPFRNDTRGTHGTTHGGPLGLDPFKDHPADNWSFSTLRSRVSQPEVPSFNRILNT